MPDIKTRLRLALNSLDDYEKTGGVTFLQLAVGTYNEVARAIGNRPPEETEESEHASR